jgi:translocation and assembly module TamA
LRAKSYIAACILGLILSGNLMAQDSLKVVLRGNRLPSGLILANRNGTIYRSDSVAVDSIKIVSAYQNQGWLDCQLQKTVEIRDHRVEISYRIQIGERYRLILIPIINGPDDSTAIAAKSIINSYSNQTASSLIIDNLANDLLQLYANDGYPYCTVNPGDYRKLENGILQVTVTIIPGPTVTIRRTEFTGLKNLDRNFLDTYSSLRPPFKYSSATVNTAAWRLSHARFIKSSADPELRYIDTPENGIIYFPIVEISSVILDGALGYSSKDKSVYGLVNGQVSNILGRGRQFGFNWLKKDKASRKLRSAFSEPLIFDQPLRLDLAAYQDDRDSLYIETGGQVGLTFTPFAAFEYGLAFGISRITPELFGRSVIPGKKRRWLTLNFIADTRDYQANPHKGDYLQFKADFINEITHTDSLFAGASINIRSARVDYQHSLSIGKSQSLYIRIFGRGDFSGDGSIDRQFPVGGFESLRGYNQDIFYVKRAAILTFEYRLLTGTEGRAYIFGDMGILQQGLGFNKTEQKAGFGIGLAAPTRPGLAIVELAAPSDEGVSAIKLHFGIKAGF